MWFYQYIRRVLANVWCTSSEREMAVYETSSGHVSALTCLARFPIMLRAAAGDMYYAHWQIIAEQEAYGGTTFLRRAYELVAFTVKYAWNRYLLVIYPERHSGRIFTVSWISYVLVVIAHACSKNRNCLLTVTSRTHNQESDVTRNENPWDASTGQCICRGLVFSRRNHVNRLRIAKQSSSLSKHHLASVRARVGLGGEARPAWGDWPVT